MTLAELQPYITGERFSREAVEPYRLDINLYKNLAQVVSESVSAQKNLDVCELPVDFYRVEPDIKYLVPMQAREEMFYALKNGAANPDVPSKLVYYIKKSYNMDKMPNLIFKKIPESELKVFFQENYLGNGYTIRDVVCSIIDPHYIPVNNYTRLVKYDNFVEVYVESTDMVAALPNPMVKNLSQRDIHNIKVDSSGLRIGDCYLRSLGGYYGAVNSIYDLRECL